MGWVGMEQRNSSVFPFFLFSQISFLGWVEVDTGGEKEIGSLGGRQTCTWVEKFL
jgi:hypothetical protein